MLRAFQILSSFSLEVAKSDNFSNFSIGIRACVGQEGPFPSSGRSLDHLVRASALPLSFPGLKTILKSY